jgi:hypothetical protein
MSPKQIEKLAYKEPFQPFRVVLENGEEVTVKMPRKASVSGDQVALVGLTRFPDGLTKEGLRFILIQRIVSAAPVDTSM